MACFPCYFHPLGIIQYFTLTLIYCCSTFDEDSASSATVKNFVIMGIVQMDRSYPQYFNVSPFVYNSPVYLLIAVTAVGQEQLGYSGSL